MRPKQSCPDIIIVADAGPLPLPRIRANAAVASQTAGDSPGQTRMIAAIWHVHRISQPQRLQRRACRLILGMSFGTMNINALVISGSDPGAVPGDSTKHPFIWDHGVETGSTNV